ncbi:MAG: hypothetical protein LBU11_03620 [Zoogloeaceae bacterium]|jgi:hypothetical protein|nr:hypothetical protein [Zoogloeaceae bacterium]
MQWIRRLRQYFSVYASSMEIRPRATWCAHVVLGAAAMLLLVALVHFWARMSRSPQEQDVEVLRARLEELESRASQGDGVLTSLEIAYNANRQLSDELRVQLSEQAVLKDDLAYFLNLVPAGVREGEVRLERFVLRPDPLSTQTNPAMARRYRYSVLAGYHAGRQTLEFSGALQFVLFVTRKGQALELRWPENQAAAEEYQVKTHHWVRKEGELFVAEGDILNKAELRLLQGNTVRATATITFQEGTGKG